MKKLAPRWHEIVLFPLPLQQRTTGNGNMFINRRKRSWGKPDPVGFADTKENYRQWIQVTGGHEAPTRMKTAILEPPSRQQFTPISKMGEASDSHTF